MQQLVNPTQVQLSFPANPLSIALDNIEEFVAVALDNGTIQIFRDTQPIQQVATITSQDVVFITFLYSQTRQLLTVSKTGLISLYSYTNQTFRQISIIKLEFLVSSCSLSMNNILLVTGFDKQYQCINCNNEILKQEQKGGQISDVPISSCWFKDQRVIGTYKGQILVNDLEIENLLDPIISLSSDQNNVLAAATEEQLIIYKEINGKLSQIKNVKISKIARIQVSSTSMSIAVSTQDNKCGIVKIE